MITIDNYFNEIKRIDFSSLPEALKKGHEFTGRVTNNGASWASYHSSETIKKAIDVYLARLNEFYKPATKSPKRHRGSSAVPMPSKVKEKKTKNAPVLPAPLMVERTAEELRFIRRFINLNGKLKTKEEILRFINSLQKAIVEKRIRKTSDYAEQVKFIQDRLIEVYNAMGRTIKIELKPETHDSLKQLTGEQKVIPSITFIKRYISMNGKAGMKEKGKKLLEQINNAYTKGKITNGDSYITEIHSIKNSLKSFITDKAQKTLHIEKVVLNGLEGILGCACQQLNGIRQLPSVMNSLDFADMEFDTIGLTGKWFDLIGDPSCNFTAMVFGKPKMGKSYLCIDFAGYMARHHGKVLYVAKEEKLHRTLQKKLNEMKAAHSNLDVASVLPANLNNYDFIFLDSVNNLKLTPDDLVKLKDANPAKSFIFVFQTTKEGKFRGANTFQHDVDVVIEVPQPGKAVQMGRFNQGGEIDIFDNDLMAT